MTHSLMARLRRFWLDVHLWIGVGLMVVLIPLSVSGAVLVWHDALDHALYAPRYAVSGPDGVLPASAYAAAAQGAFGERAALTQVRLPQTPGDPVVAVGRIVGPAGPNGRPRTLNAWIDPPTGRVLDVAEVAKGFSMTLHRLHGTLLIPDIGRKVVGWLGWAMLISSATGLWLWWPRHGAFLKGLRWRRGAAQLFNLHHMVAFWLCLPLAVLSATGVYISFPQTSHALFAAAGAQPQQPPMRRGPDPRFAPPLAKPRMTLDEATAAALAQAPGARIATVNLPQAGKAPAWRIELAAPEGKPPKSVRVLDATGQVKAGGDRAGGGGAQDPFSRWMRRIHDGTDLGPIWRSLITLAGIAPAVLGITGLVMWLRRRERRLKVTRLMREA